MEATMHQAKSQLSRLVERAMAGEKVILKHGRARRPVARLVPIDSGTPTGEIRALPVFKSGKRPIGIYKGQFDIGPEFFEPPPDEELALWEGSANDELLFGSK